MAENMAHIQQVNPVDLAIFQQCISGVSGKPDAFALFGLPPPPLPPVLRYPALDTANFLGEGTQYLAGNSSTQENNTTSPNTKRKLNSSSESDDVSTLNVPGSSLPRKISGKPVRKAKILPTSIGATTALSEEGSQTYDHAAAPVKPFTLKSRRVSRDVGSAKVTPTIFQASDDADDFIMKNGRLVKRGLKNLAEHIEVDLSEPGSDDTKISEGANTGMQSETTPQSLITSAQNLHKAGTSGKGSTNLMRKKLSGTVSTLQTNSRASRSPDTKQRTSSTEKLHTQHSRDRELSSSPRRSVSDDGRDRDYINDSRGDRGWQQHHHQRVYFIGGRGRGNYNHNYGRSWYPYQRGGRFFPRRGRGFFANRRNFVNVRRSQGGRLVRRGVGGHVVESKKDEMSCIRAAVDAMFGGGQKDEYDTHHETEAQWSYGKDDRMRRHSDDRDTYSRSSSRRSNRSNSGYHEDVRSRDEQRYERSASPAASREASSVSNASVRHRKRQVSDGSKHPSNSLSELPGNAVNSDSDDTSKAKSREKRKEAKEAKRRRKAEKSSKRAKDVGKLDLKHASEREPHHHRKKSKSKRKKEHAKRSAARTPSPSNATEQTARRPEKFTFFFTKKYPFSNHYPCTIEIDKKRFNCSEQYYMYMKAASFKDYDTAERILKASEPKEQKRLGAQVKNFDEAKWSELSKMYMCLVSDLKYRQNEHLRRALFSTLGTTLVECNPSDRRWGIGLSMDDPRIFRRSEWRGANWLGDILSTVRDSMAAEPQFRHEAAEFFDEDGSEEASPGTYDRRDD